MVKLNFLVVLIVCSNFSLSLSLIGRRYVQMMPTEKKQQLQAHSFKLHFDIDKEKLLYVTHMPLNVLRHYLLVENDFS